MFVYINVIEDITAYFGREANNFYLEGLEHSITVFATLYDLFIFGFFLFAMYQCFGKLPF